MRINKLLCVLGIIVPAIIVFKSLFLSGSLAWGDAPHFYLEGLSDLVSEPMAWVNRGLSFGGLNKFIFLWPLMFIYGIIGKVVGNDFAIRTIFYFPSIIFSIVGVYFLARYIKLSRIVSFFSIFIYVFNTYYLLLIDGGQVGVALAYGLFPITLMFLKMLADNPSANSFYLSIELAFILAVVDPRVAIIAILTVVLWQILEFKVKSLLVLIPHLALLTLLSMYWLLPLVKNGVFETTLGPGQTGAKWYYPFTLFSPHWPANVFGDIYRPPVYFIGITVLIFLSLLFRRRREILIYNLLFLIFSFFSLGLSMITSLPFGFALRDTTKFFIPLILFGGILIGSTIESFSLKLKGFNRNALLLLSYSYLLFIISPAVLGRLNFNLSTREPSQDYQKIYENLKRDTGFYRTLWFPETHPLTYETPDNPAVNARDLSGFRPFAFMNASEDVFNFLNNEDFVEWFRIFGIKYLVMSDNAREIAKTSKDQKDWDTISGLVASNKKLEKVDWKTKIPVYKVNNTYPRFYAVKQLFGVIGPSLASSNHFPSIYFEDGKWGPEFLRDKDPGAISLVFNGTDESDLVLSFLQKYFKSSKDAYKNDWASYSPDDYLKYKYELLIRGVKFIDFDYSRGIAFSTVKGEKLHFKFDVKEDGDYVFVYRIMNPTGGDTHFGWVKKALSLKKGTHEEVIENTSGITVFNVAALIPEKEFVMASSLSEKFISTFKVQDVNSIQKDSSYKPIELQTFGALKYNFIPPIGLNWILFTDNYNKLWKLRKGVEYSESVPVYSMINGFYIEDKWTDLGIEFKGQENLRWGVYISTLTLLALSAAYLWFSMKDPRNN